MGSVPIFFLKYGLVISLVLIILLIAFGKLLLQEHAGLPLSRSQVNKLIKAAESGDAEVCWVLYHYYIEDDKKELYWLQKAVDYGYPRAQMHLASRLLTQGNNKGRLKALDLLNKAAKQDYANAQGELGRWYRDGTVVTQDLSMAEYWLRRAANKGSVSDMKDLAKLLVISHQDNSALVESYKWTLVALMRAPKKSGYAKEARYIQDDIMQKAKKLDFNIDKIKRDADVQAVELEKQIPVELDPIEEQKILMQNVLRKYGNGGNGMVLIK